MSGADIIRIRAHLATRMDSQMESVIYTLFRGSRRRRRIFCSSVLHIRNSSEITLLEEKNQEELAITKNILYINCYFGRQRKHNE